uniref:Uncharacterized protein n=1 Tax=Noctiluca scintillans TaxID=2966 RepID=A0A7S1FDH9_NOCSC|mmetsp:Transcript_52406/g.139522  ORF Transcript_52406/g.139522 Transcript_52406/m.139522 type:complete len:172 (+) Transcript_52406:59-574(+)
MARTTAHVLVLLGVTCSPVSADTQCDAVPYEYCCNLGVPCNCILSQTATGQCAASAYDFCCNLGTPCDCDAARLNVSSTANVQELVDVSARPLAIPDAPTIVKEPPLATGASEPLAQCEAVAYQYCCHLGVPCNCILSQTATGQCAASAYDFCCNLGTPCDCDASLLNVTV